MQRTLTFTEAAAFFVPLIFWAQLMMITHTVIHGWLARGAFPTVALAGFSIAFSINGLLGSAFRAFHPISLTFMKDRRSVWRILSLGAVMVAGSTTVMLLMALTPLGQWVYGGLMGAGPEVVVQAQAASLFFAWVFPFQLTRNVAGGMLMLARRTTLIATGTLARVLSLAAFLAALSLAVQGAPLGAAALLLCIAVEAGLVIAFAIPFYRERPAVSGTPASYGEIWRFGWPVILNSMAENGLVVVINVFLGRLADPDRALASFGVARGLLMVMVSPLRNLAQTAQLLTRTAEDLRVVKRFAVLVSAGFIGVILILFYTPLRGAILESVLGLSAALSAAVVPGVMWFAVAPVLWGGASLYRGLVSGARHTSVLAATSGVRLGAASVVAAASLFWPQANGALLGIAALCAAFAAEAVVLAVSTGRLVRAGQAYGPTGAEEGTGKPPRPSGDTRK